MSKKQNLPVVWQLSIIQFPARVLLRGTLLHSSPYVFDKEMGLLEYSLKLARSYFSKPFSNRSITIQADGFSTTVETDNNGQFSIFVDDPNIYEVKIYETESKTALRVNESYPVFFKESEARFDIISDIDDTIMQSFSTNTFKRFKATGITLPKNRKSISFTKELLQQCSHSRVFYVSKSEANLLGILSTFIDKAQLPAGALFLTPMISLVKLSGLKKPEQHKWEEISVIIENSKPDKKFVLIGDDTQGDILVYSQLTKKYKDRLVKIYIRKTRKELIGKRKEAMDQLMNSGIPVLYFSGNDSISAEIANLKKLPS